VSSFETYHLRVTMQVQSPVELDAYKGSAIRGALINALRRHYCTAPALPAVRREWQEHVPTCPACRLVAAEDASRARGQDLPRAYVIEPPLSTRTRYEPGEELAFGVGLFSDAISLYPYLLSALSLMGGEGLGRRLRENGGERGRLVLRRVDAYNPLTRERMALMGEQGSAVPSSPALPVTHELVQQEARRWPTDRLTLRFLTPTRITDGGRLVRKAEFRPFFARLLGRIADLWQAYGRDMPEIDFAGLTGAAEAVAVVSDETVWTDPFSRSGRTGRRVPIGGYVGTATYRGDFVPLLPWLLWGQCVHVGKNAVKGNGWYELLP